MTDDEMKLNFKRQLEAWKRCDGFEFSDYELEMCKRYNVAPHYSDDERKIDRDMELEIYQRYNIEYTDDQPELDKLYHIESDYSGTKTPVWTKSFTMTMGLAGIFGCINGWVLFQAFIA